MEMKWTRTGFREDVGFRPVINHYSPGESKGKEHGT